MNAPWSRRLERPFWSATLSGVAVALVAVAVRLQFVEVLGTRVLFGLLYPAPLVAAAIGGIRPAIATGLVSLLLANGAFYPDAWLVPTPGLDRLQLTGFVVFTLGVGWLIERERKATWQARMAVRDAIAEGEARRREAEERRRAEEVLQAQLRQAQQMEGIGRLAGGVAHDFNNLLTGILGFTDLAEMSPELSGETRAYLQQIRQAGEHAARLTRQLLAFARRQVIAPQAADLNRVLTDLHPFLRRLVDAPIELVTLPAQDLWPVMIDRTQIEQVVVNLAINARDALGGHGRLTLSTHNLTVVPGSTGILADVPPGEYVALVVSDNGAGMEEAVKQRAFEPFFTTKPPGEASGLGLSTCHGIVTQHGGHIRVESEPGQGATFTILLPRGNVAAAAPDAEVAPLALPHEVVLVAEDEVLVRNLAVSSLQRAGYQVLQAASGTEALEVARRHAGSIHLLITDVVMPHMNGVQLAAALGAERPDTRVLFTSGYSHDAVSVGGMLRPGVEFLPKPYTPVTLCRAARRVLDAPASTAAPGAPVEDDAATA